MRTDNEHRPRDGAGEPDDGGLRRRLAALIRGAGARLRAAAARVRGDADDPGRERDARSGAAENRQGTRTDGRLRVSGDREGAYIESDVWEEVRR